MTCYLSLFSPDTYAKFLSSDKTTLGFRERSRASATRIKPGDIFLGYLTMLSRWVGAYEVISGPFEERTPIFTRENDPFVVRFKVKPLVSFSPENAIPIRDTSMWNHLSMTRDSAPKSSRCTGFFRSSLNEFSESDGRWILNSLLKSEQSPVEYPLDHKERRLLEKSRVRRPEGEILVTVPEDENEEDGEDVAAGSRDGESTKIQALIAKIGYAMGFRIWLPANNRTSVPRFWDAPGDAFVDELPLSYDESTLKTIRQIDVLWLKRRSIVRAFEVEHTTAIYSGILRMADLLSLQPNMDIRLHIVAPEARKLKVFQELTRPVFSLLERKPLAEVCSFISYDAVNEIAAIPHLPHVSDTILDEYIEHVE